MAPPEVKIVFTGERRALWDRSAAQMSFELAADIKEREKGRREAVQRLRRKGG
jgi:hypothetical protein